MPKVEFTPHLKRYFPDLKPLTVKGGTVAEVVAALDKRHKGIADYIVDERGCLRKHVNIFIGQEPVLDRNGLSDKVAKDETVFIFQALSGG